MANEQLLTIIISILNRKQAEAVADALRKANQAFVTKADLKAEMAVLRADLYRALWLQTGAIVAAVAGLLAIVSRL